jgi:hypothetical protein
VATTMRAWRLVIGQYCRRLADMPTSCTTGEVSLDQPDRVGQERGRLRVDPGLALERVDEPRAEIPKGCAMGAGEQEGSDEIHLGGADGWIAPKLSSVPDAERARERHELGGLPGHRRFVRPARVLGSSV